MSYAQPSVSDSINSHIEIKQKPAPRDRFRVKHNSTFNKERPDGLISG